MTDTETLEEGRRLLQSVDPHSYSTVSGIPKKLTLKVFFGLELG